MKASLCESIYMRSISANLQVLWDLIDRVSSHEEIIIWKQAGIIITIISSLSSHSLFTNFTALDVSSPSAWRLRCAGRIAYHSYGYGPARSGAYGVRCISVFTCCGISRCHLVTATRSIECPIFWSNIDISRMSILNMIDLALTRRSIWNMVTPQIKHDQPISFTRPPALSPYD